MNVVVFVSRNKDNKEVKDFKERRNAFITDLPSDSPELLKKFNYFVNEGKDGELSRFYYSVNKRDETKVYKALLHELIDNPDIHLWNLEAKVASIAAQKSCAGEKRWLYDFDIDDENKVNEFKNDIIAIDPEVEVTIYKTLHGYAVVTSRGFDVRKIDEKWPKEFVTLKKDDLLFIKASTKDCMIC